LIYLANRQPPNPDKPELKIEDCKLNIPEKIDNPFKPATHKQHTATRIPHPIAVRLGTFVPVLGVLNS